jgi:sterol 3beta-glucosyltransferase
MRIAIVTYGTRGDVQPFVAVGQTLQARGHDVVVGVPEDYTDFVRASGLAVQAIEGKTADLLASPSCRRWVQEGNVRALGRAVVDNFRALSAGVERDVHALCEGADVVVTGVLPSALSRTFATWRGIPWVVAHLSPGTPSSSWPLSFLDLPLSLPGPVNRLTTSLAWWVFWSILRDLDDDTRARLGVARATADPCMEAHRTGAKTLHLWSPTLLPPPPEWGAGNVVAGFCTMRPSTRIALAEDAAVTALEGFLAAGPPPVFLGLGSMPLASPKRTVGMMVEALSSMGCRALIGGSFGQRDEVAALLPETMRLVGAIDHEALFPRCAAVVHHGGVGSLHTGLRAGRSTLVCSVLGDQPFWGRVIERRGVGTWTRFRTLTTTTLRQGLEHILRDDVKARAQALGEALRAEPSGNDVAADVIEAVARRRGSSPGR